jgi:hypothetical protein
MAVAGCSSSGQSAARPTATTTIPPSSLRASSTTSQPPPAAHEVAAGHDDTVFSFGDASFLGSTARRRLVAPVVAMAETPDGNGYWLAARDGGVFRFGTAAFHGSLAGRQLAQPIVGIAATPTGKGYWLAAADGGVFRFGDARFYGGLAGRRLHAPVIGITSADNGYYLLARDGGVFRFGNARFYGATAAKRLNAPIAGMAATPSGKGYWLVGRDGGVFAFGDARFAGSATTTHLNAPAVGIVGAGRSGYWIVTGDGGLFTFGDARFLGSATGQIPSSRRVAQLVGVPDGSGYRMLVLDAPRPPHFPPAGGVTAIGDSVMIDATPALIAIVPGISVDAGVSRQVGDGIARLGGLAATGHLGGEIVWGLGTNGTFTAAQLDQVLRIAAGRPVVVITEHCGYCSWTPENNAMIHANCVAARHCTIADFDALANANPGWFGGDTVHMAIGGPGARAYAQLVLDRL